MRPKSIRAIKKAYRVRMIYVEKAIEARETVIKMAKEWRRTEGTMAPELWRAVEALLELEKGKL